MFLQVSVDSYIFLLQLQNLKKHCVVELTIVKKKKKKKKTSKYLGNFLYV